MKVDFWIPDKKSALKSINNLLADFMIDQQKEFIATSSNVQQTVEKLKETIKDKMTKDELRLCEFCMTVC